MKAILRILVGLVILIVLALVLLPVLFKDNIVELVKEQANANLNAQVDFGEFDLSLISSFPNFQFEISDITVNGVDDFEGVQLLRLGRLETTVDMMSVIKGDEINVRKFGISDLDLNIIVNEDGEANYDIAVESDEDEEQEVEEEGTTAFKLGLSEYYLRNVNLTYDDQEGDMYARIKGLDHSGNGDFTQDVFDLTTKTIIQSLTYRSEGIHYLKNASLSSDLGMSMDMPNSKYTFADNSLTLNDLHLNFAGWIAMPDEDIDMDMSMSSPDTKFKSILSMIPAVYAKDFESVETDGTFNFAGTFKGRYTDDALPTFNLELNVKDASFHYPDMPKSATNIQVGLKVSNAGGSEDNTVIDLRQFHVEMAENPVDIAMNVKTPVSDPQLKGKIQAQISMATVAEVYPMDMGEKYGGSLTADISMEGRLSAIEEERYEDFNTDGKLIILDMDYSDSSLPYVVNIKKAYFDFSPQFVDMSTLELKILDSDIQASGKIENFLPYYFHDSTISGNLTLASTNLDLDQLMGPEEEEAEVEEGDEEPFEVLEVPGNINFRMNSNLGKVLYDGLEMTNMKGTIWVHDSKVDMRDLSFNMMDGSMAMSGVYDASDISDPKIDFDMNLSQWDIAKTFETFNTVQKLAPIAESARGRFSTSLKFVCSLDSMMDPELNTLTGGGKLKSHDIVVDGSNSLKKVATVLKNDRYSRLDLKDVNLTYKFENGRVNVEPFDIKMGNSKATVSGSNGFDLTMDYLIKTEIPTKDLGKAAESATGILAKQASKVGVDLKGTDKVKVDLKVTGDVNDPNVTPVFAGGKEAVKENIKDELKKQKEELEKKAREEAERLRKEAEKKAREEAEKAKKAAEEKAREEAERLKKEAEQKAKEEAEKKKKQAEEELKKKAKEGVKDLFKKR